MVASNHHRPGEGKLEGFVKNARVWLADGDVRRLTLSERGLYDDLLCQQWEDGGLPDDAASLGRQFGARAGMVRKVLDEFFELGQDGCRRNPKLEAQRRSALEARREREEKRSAERTRKRRGKDAEDQ